MHKNGYGNPWKTLRSRVAYRGKEFLVRDDEVIRPDGKPDHYTYLDGKIIATIVALNEKNEVALVTQWRYVLKRRTLEIPSGTSNNDETDPLAVAKRELLEEAGVRAKQWTLLGNGYTSISTAKWNFFLAQDLTVGKPAPEGTEDIAVHWLPLEEALKKVDTGEISSHGSIIGLLRADRYLKLQTNSSPY